MTTATAHQPYWRSMTEDSQKALVQEMIESGGKKRAQDMLVNTLVQEMIDPDGGLHALEFNEEVDVSEMINTSQGQMDLLEKVRVDVAFGLAEIPLLYGPLYERIAPAGGFPGGMFEIDANTLMANVVFLEKFEGGEVQFGTLAKTAPSLGKIQTYAAGFEWTEDMIEYDRTYQIEMNNRAFGRSYNALLNHLHLSPIIGNAYPGANLTPADATGATLQERTHLTLQAGYLASVMATPRRTGTVLLASEANRFQIEDALLTPVRDDQGNPLPNIPIRTIIYYDGEDVQRGSDVFHYPGVTPGTCFLIMPKRKMKEMLHHDLRIDIGPADISRLVEGQQVGRARRGSYVDLNGSVEKITLPV